MKHGADIPRVIELIKPLPGSEKIPVGIKLTYDASIDVYTYDNKRISVSRSMVDEYPDSFK